MPDDNSRHPDDDGAQRAADKNSRDVDQDRAVQHVELIANLAASLIRSKRKRD